MKKDPLASGPITLESEIAEKDFSDLFSIWHSKREDLGKIPNFQAISTLKLAPYLTNSCVFSKSKTKTDDMVITFVGDGLVRATSIDNTKLYLSEIINGETILVAALEALSNAVPLILRGHTLNWAEKDHKTVDYLCLPFQSLESNAPDSLLYYAIIHSDTYA